MRKINVGERLKLLTGRNSVFALCVALGVTALVFLPYFGQWLYSDVVTFHKRGDQLQQTFPLFMQAWKIFTKNGIDIGTFNGATEGIFKLAIHPVFVAFSFLGEITTFRFAYILFFAVHMVAAIYFGILTGIRFFGLSKKNACLCALCSLTTLFIGSWFYSLYVNAALLFPCLYCALRVIGEKRKLVILFCSLPIAFLLLGGYITVSVFEMVFLFAVSVLYSKFWCKTERGIIFTIVECALPFLIAGLVILPYYIQLLIYMTQAVSSSGAMASMWGATDLPLIPKDLVSAISYAFSILNPIERPDTIYIGLGWLSVFIAYMVCKRKVKISGGKRVFVLSSLLFCLLFSLTIMGAYLPFQFWFYASVPIVGSMHLPIRYLLFMMPCVFLCLTILWENTDFEIGHKQYLITILSTIGGIMFFLFKRTSFELIDENILIIELIFFLGFVYCAKQNIRSTATTICLIFCTTIMPLQNDFYENTTMRLTASDFETSSIVYSESKRNELDTFISSVEQKDSYKIVSYESDSSAAPVYIPDNYAWYDETLTLTHYLGYPLHASIPQDYATRFPWFNSIDWTYVANTRGDFAILDPAEVEANPDLFNTLIDWDYPACDLNETHRVYKLKEFIPSYYTGTNFVVDFSDSYDNGYFYCPDLTESDVISFETDESTFFTLELNAKDEMDIAFLLYPNRNFVYYVDGEIVEPAMHEMQVFISVPAGEHEIEVKCENTTIQMSIAVQICYYVVICAAAVVFLFVPKIRKQEKYV